MNKETPYIEEVVTETLRKYNPKYGDDRICKCGHPYYRHFDGYDDNRNVGCKYCGCHNFTEREETDLRIKRLLREVNPPALATKQGFIYTFDKEHLSKLVELVVNECAESLEVHSSQLFGNDGWIEECQDNIKEYFGVTKDERTDSGIR